MAAIVTASTTQNLVDEIPSSGLLALSMEVTPLQRACTLVGGQAALGRKIGRSQSTIWNWLQRGIPADDCPAIETATDGRVTCHDLRPDVFRVHRRKAKKASG